MTPDGAAHLIDAHVHLMTPERTASGIRWIRRVVPDYQALPETTTAVEVLAHVEAAGAEVVFSLFYPLRGGESRRINRWHSRFAGWAARRPGGGAKVVAFASVHPDDDDPGRVAEEALGTLDLAGLKLHPYVQRLDPLDPRLSPALAAAQESGRPLIIHTGFAAFYGQPDLAAAVFALAERYPRLRIVAAHLLYPELPLGAWPRYLERYPNLYLDATNVLSVAGPGTPDGESLARLLDVWSHRFVFGSDHPMGMAYPVDKLYTLARAAVPTDRAREDLLWRTAAGLVERRRLPEALARDLEGPAGP